MKSELYQRAINDPKSLTQDEAMTVFTEIVNDITREQNLDVSNAWVKARQLNPNLYARLCHGKQPAPDASALANGGTAPARPSLMALLSQKPFITSALHLPNNVDNDILNAAFVANGSQFVTVDSKKVFLAVQTCLMKTNGLNAADTRRVMLDDYPELCRFAKQTLND